MTYPSGGTPESAANYSSLATFAAKTEEDWTAELTDPVDAKATAVRDGLWADLPTGEGFGLTLLKELAKRILPLDAIADWTFIEDVLVALDGWASDINAVVGEVLQDLVDFFSNLLDRSGFLSILEQVIEFFSDVGGELSGFLTVFEEIVVFFADILDRSGFFAVLQTVIEFFGTIADGTLDTFLAAFKAVVDFFLGITDFTLEQVFAVLGDLIDFFGELLDRSGFLAVFKDVTDFFSAAGGGALSTVLAALGDLVDWLITIVDRSGFLEVLRQVVDFFIGIADGVRDAFLDTVSNVVAFFDSLSLDDFTLEAFIEALGEAVNRLAMGVIPLDDIGRWVENTIVLPVVGALTGDGSKLDLGALGVWARNLLGRNDKIPADNLIGQISTALFGVIPLSSISDTQPNLLAAGNFDLSTAVYDPGAEFVWDGTQSRTGTGGSLQCAADGSTHDIFSTQSIPAAQGDKVNLSAWVKTSGYAGTGTPISVSLIPFKGTVQQTAVTVASTGAQSSWAQISGQYTVPADVTSLRVRLAVTNAATAGTVNFDDIHLTKTGLLQQGWVERLTDAWNNFWFGIFGGVLPDNKDVDDVYTAAASVSNVANTADSNALSALSQLGELLWNLLNVPATIIGSIVDVVMDGVATVGNFLSDLWDAFTGQSATNKTVAEVKAAASGVTSTANTASTTATSAASAAAVADGKAVIAQAKADAAAQQLDAAIQSGANICNNPDAALNLVDGNMRSTDYARTGTHSVKIVSEGAVSTYYQGWLANSTQLLKAACAHNDWFYIEYWVRAADGNVGGGNVVVFLRSIDSAGNSLNSTKGLAVANNAAIKGGFYKQAGIVQMTAAEIASIQVASITDAGVPQGDTVYIDSVKVIRITEAYNALLDASAAASAASAAQTSADAADGKAVLAQSAADDADAKAVAAQSILASVIESGANLCTNPSFENTRFKLSNGANEYSTTVAHSGSRSMKMTGTGNYITQGLVSDENISNYYVPAQPDDVWWVEMRIYGDPGNVNPTGYLGMVLRCKDKDGNLCGYAGYGGSDNKGTSATNVGTGSWYTLSGYVIAPANTVAMQPYLQLGNSIPAGHVYYFDDCRVVRVTEAYWAQQTGNAASNAASAAQTSADTADGKAVIADGKAVAAQSVTSTFIASGTNICPNPSFENTNFLFGKLDAEYSTERARTGSRSMKLTRTGTAAPFAYVIQSPTSTDVVYVPVAEGDVLYLEFWVYGHADNTSSGGTTRMVVAWADTAKSTVGYAIPYVVADSSLKNKWTKVSGFYTAPAGAAFFRAYLDVTTGTDAGDIFYFDDVVIQRVTEGYVADGKAVAAQTTANSATSAASAAQTSANTADGKAVIADGKAVAAQNTADAVAARVTDAEQFLTSQIEGGANLCTNPDAEIETAIGGARRSTDFARTGTHSAKLVGTGSLEYYEGMCADKTKMVRIGCSDQDWFYIEYYLRGHPDNLGTSGYHRFFLRVKREDNQTLQWLNVTTNNSVSLKSGWQKVTAIVQADHPDTVGIEMSSLVSADLNVGDAIYADSFKVIRITEAYNALLDASAAASAASAAQTSADTADGKAVIADGKAVTADGKAVTADGKAVAAQSAASAAQTSANTADGKAVAAQNTIDRVASTANLVESPSFEDSSVVRIPYQSETPLSYETAQKYVGSQSLRWKNSPTATWRGVYLTPTGTNQYFEVSPGETISASVYVRPYGNYTAHAGYVKLFMRWSTSGSSGYEDTSSGGNVLYNADMGTWSKLTSVGTCPAGRNQLLVFVINDPSTPLNNMYYVDSVSVQRVSPEAITAQETIDTSNTVMYNAWFGSGGSGSTQNVSDTISSIKESVGSWTVEVLTTSQTWTRPTATSNILEFWAICVGGGSGGGRGFSGITGAPGGEGGSGGRWLAKAIDPSTLTSTVSVTVGAGGAGRNSSSSSNSVASPENMTNSSFGSYATTGTGITASIASFVGYYSCEDSRPGRGGDGGAESGGGQAGEAGQSTPLASGGTAGSATNNGGAGGNATLTGQTRAGGGGGGGGGGGVAADVGNGGNGGWPGGGGGGGGGSWTANTSVAGNGGNGGNGAVILCYRLVE